MNKLIYRICGYIPKDGSLNNYIQELKEKHKNDHKGQLINFTLRETSKK